MGDKSKIEWTDATWNPTIGCSLVSAGCTNCYAMKQAHRFSGQGQAYEGLTRLTSNGPVWTGEVRLNEKALVLPLRWKRPRRIFVNSMSDLFHESLDPLTVGRVLNVIGEAKHHTFQVLTKRAEHARDLLLAYYNTLDLQPYPNLWLGVSVEDQTTFDERWPLLRDTPAAVRWISYEPALGRVDFSECLPIWRPSFQVLIKSPPFANWVVCGGESGLNARPMHPDWVRLLRDQCVAAGVPFFFKQWGRWYPVTSLYEGRNDSAENGYDRLEQIDRRGHLWTDSEGQPNDSRTWLMAPVGKKRAGRKLDGREWNEYPNT